MLSPKAIIVLLTLVAGIQALSFYWLSSSHSHNWIMINPLMPALTRADESTALILIPNVPNESAAASTSDKVTNDTAIRLELLSEITLAQSDRSQLEKLLKRAEALEKQGQSIRHEIESIALRIHAQLTPEQIECLAANQSKLYRINSEHALVQKLRELFHQESTRLTGETP